MLKQSKWHNLLRQTIFLASLLCFVGLGYSANIRAETDAASEEWVVSIPGGEITDNSSPTIANVDNDEYMEIIIGSSNIGNPGSLTVLEHNGTIKWSREIPYGTGIASTIADISNPPDGVPEIIVSTGSDVNAPTGTAGTIRAYSNTGSLLWSYTTTGEPPFPDGVWSPAGNFAAPVVGDVDGNGDMEIVANSLDRNIYMLDHNGNRVWFYHVADTVWSTPVLYDLNSDGDLEIITGTDITEGGVLPDGTTPTDGGFLLVLDKNGQKLARRQINETIYSSIAFGDVDHDGQIEFFVGTGYAFFMQGNYTQPYVYGFRIDTSGSTWQVVDLPGWPRPVARAGISSPALADLDNDGDLEVVIGSGYEGLGPENACSNSSSDPDCHGAVYAWHHNGQAVSGFPVWPREANGKNGFIRSSPTVGDVDNDGQKEILICIGWTIIVLNHNGSTQETLPTRWSVFNSPAIVDLDADGRTNIIVGNSDYDDPGQGYVRNFEYGAGSYDATGIDWPMFRRDAQHSGFVPPLPTMVIHPSSLTVAHDTDDGNSTKAYIWLENTTNGTSFTWSASTPSGVSLSPNSGTVSTTQWVEVTINANRPNGWYDIGNLTIYGNYNGQVINGSPTQIPITLFVGNLHDSYLPLALGQ